MLRKLTSRTAYVAYVAVFGTLLLLVGALLQQKQTLQKQVETLHDEKNSLATLVEQKEAQLEYRLEDDTDGSIGKTYEDWIQSNELAIRFYNDSDGQFQKDWAQFLINYAEEKEVDPYIVYELIKVESGNTFDPELVGPDTKYGRAYGLTQFMTNTAPWIAEMEGLDYSKDKLFNPYYSIQLAIIYLDFLYDRYGNWNEALTAYHRGIGGLDKYMRENGDAKSWYATKIQQKAMLHQNVAVMP